MDCPYCGAGSDLKDAKVVFGENTNYGLVYVCRNFPECNTYVGAHANTHWPKGTLGNAELRFYRIEAHRVFDKLTKRIPRSHAYKLLAQEMGLDSNTAHIGHLDIGQCQLVIEIFSNYDLSSQAELPPPILKKNKKSLI